MIVTKEYRRVLPAGFSQNPTETAVWQWGLLDCVAGFAAFCSADDASAFAAAFGFFGNFGFGLWALDHGRISWGTACTVSKVVDWNRCCWRQSWLFRAICLPSGTSTENVGGRRADERDSAGRAVYRGESAETISFSRGISESAIAEFRFREVRDIMHGCLGAC